MQDGLRAIGIYTTTDECDLIVSRYDTSGDRRLDMREFEKAFLAKDAYYASNVARRGSNYRPPIYGRDDVFYNPSTRADFAAMMRTHVRVENESESLRQRLNTKPGYNAYDAFNSLDLNEDGRFSAFEMRRMCESRGYFVTQKECDAVVDKMDSNKDGRISYGEFAEKTRNQSPVRR